MVEHVRTVGRTAVAPEVPFRTQDGSAPAARTARTADPGPAHRPASYRARRRGRLTGGPALYLLASLTVALLAASAAPTPLYAIYQARWGFTPITTTIVFGVYAVAVLTSLLTLGKLSDHVGRRPVLLSALAVQAASLLMFASASGVPELLIGRIIQGLATGAALGAIGAALLDIDRERGTFANSVAPGMGTGSGVLLSALAVRYLPAPTHLIYVALAGVIVLQAAGVALLRETVTRAPGALASLRPEIRLPRSLRGPVLTATPVLFAVWALAGLYAALGPALVHDLTGSADVVLGGLSLFVLTVTAVAAIVALRRADARTVMLTGILTLIAGVAVTVLALGVRSTPLFFAGTAISGVGFGAGFQGSIRTVVPRAAAHERAGVLSLLYIVSYLGLGVPAVAAGFAIVHGGGLTDTALYYGGAVILLAALALPGLLGAGARAARGPVTSGPVTSGPVTGGPVTGGPVTGGPVTGGPVTDGPAASGPETGSLATRDLVTGAPVTGGQPAARHGGLREVRPGERMERVSRKR